MVVSAVRQSVAGAAETELAEPDLIGSANPDGAMIGAPYPKARDARGR
jgi:hypothetical protein